MQTNNLTKLGSEKTKYTDQYDPSQLELIEREPRRIGYTAPMNGYDIWTAFEVSFLLPSGLPCFFVIRIANPADSKYIFESKSLKLYLNSFNNTVCESKEDVIQMIRVDLSKVTEADIKVKSVDRDFLNPDFLYNKHYCIENMLENQRVKITEYNYSKDLLKTMSNYIDKEKKLKLHLGSIEMYSDLLRSNCEITNQPDWARVYINFTPDEFLLDYQSILKYIVSYRNHNEFHEPTCERIYNDLYELLKPKELTVLCQYTRRGGIDINAYRSTEKVDIIKALNIPKLLQQ